MFIKAMIQTIKKHYIELVLFCLFVLIHVPSLGMDNFNTDVWKWKSRIYDFGSGVFTLNFDKTVQKYHPGVTLMWIGTVAVKAYNLYYDIAVGSAPKDNSINTVFELDAVQKLFVVLSLAITLLIVFYPLMQTFGKTFYIVSFLLITLEPFFLAMSRVIHLEALMSVFMLGAVIWLYKYYTDPTRKLSTMIIFAVFTSLAVLTKTSSLFLLPFIGLVMFYRGHVSKNIKISFVEYSKFLLIFVIAFVLVWPAMLTNPLLALNALYRGIFTIGVERGHEQFYFGKYVLDPDFTFYFVVLAIKSSIYLLPALIAFLFLAKKDRAQTPIQKFCLYMFIFGATYLLFLLISSKKLDRYILPTMLSFTFCAGYILIRLEEKLKSNLKILVILPLILSVIMLVRIHPDYFSYFNPLFGGLKFGIYAVEPKWLIGKSEILAYLSELKVQNNLKDFTAEETLNELLETPEIKTKLVVGFNEKYYTQIWPFVRQIGGWAVIQDLTGEAKHAKYFVYPVWDDAGAKEDRFSLTRLSTIKIRGVDVYNVYARN